MSHGDTECPSLGDTKEQATLGMNLQELCSLLGELFWGELALFLISKPLCSISKFLEESDQFILPTRAPQSCTHRGERVC